MRKDYIERLAALLQERKLDAMLISPSEELLFFTGLDLMLCERMQGLFVLADGRCFYVCNDIYTGEVDEGVEGQLPIFSWHDNEGMFKAVDAAFAQYGLNGKTIAVNTTGQVCNLLDIAEHSGVRLVNGRALLEEVRIRKSHEELENMRKSAAVADSVFEPVCRLIRPGVTEAQVRDLMVDIMTKAGGNTLDVIVASGPNSSYPHYSRYDRTIQEGGTSFGAWRGGAHRADFGARLRRRDSRDEEGRLRIRVQVQQEREGGCSPDTREGLCERLQGRQAPRHSHRHQLLRQETQHRRAAD